MERRGGMDAKQEGGGDSGETYFSCCSGKGGGDDSSRRFVQTSMTTVTENCCCSCVPHYRNIMCASTRTIFLPSYVTRSNPLATGAYTPEITTGPERIASNPLV